MRIRDDIAANSHRVRLTHCMRIRGKNHMALTCTMKTLCMYMGKQFTHYVLAKARVCAKTVFVPKTICVGSSHSFWISEFTTMGESLIDLVWQYPALWDKQDIMYKDSSYKEAKWKEIAEILHLTKEEVIRKWKSLRDTYVRHKNNKSKSGDGLSQCKPKWKYYDIMSFIDITLLKQRYVPIYLITSYLQQIPNRQLCVILILSKMDMYVSIFQYCVQCCWWGGGR